MKKGLIVLIVMISTFMLAPIVKADTTIITIDKLLPSEDWCSLSGCNNTYEQAKEDIINYYEENYKEEYPYYTLTYDYAQGNKLLMIISKNTSYTFEATIDSFAITLGNESIGIIHSFSNNSFVETGGRRFTATQDINRGNYYSLIDTNITFKVSGNNYEFAGFYNDNIVLNIGDNVPTYDNLIQYNSWADYESNHLEGYTEVNLDNYEYVLLNLKNYNQTQAFQTNLQVKGQMGITPIYNYGQTSKDNITGVKVQDRCNIAYENYTIYPFYVLQQDLQNNAIYAVKKCSSGSSFKFDNTIFDITYITQKNIDEPTITINGKTYNVIPYDKLPSTATENEEENYIPGESGNANDTGGLDNAIKNAQQKMSEIWDTITYFTDFINQIFSALPEELRVILVSAFTIMIIIGLIKIFLG